MSLKELSKHLAAHGRHGDTELVHVSKDELRTLHGLAALQGTHMTTNPHTGLPEAFNLGGLFKTILPVAAGIGGSFVGMPWLGALAAGALTTAETGSLEKGLMAGMGSYAMGGLGNAALNAGATNLANAAAQGATQAGTQAGAQAASQVAQQAAAQGIPGAAAQLAGQGAADAAAQGATQGAMSAALPEAAQGVARESLAQSFPNLTPDQLAQVTSEGTPELMGQRAAMLNQFGQANYNLSPTGTITQAPPIGGQFNPTWQDKLGALSVGDYANVAMENPAMTIGAGMHLMNSFTPEPTMPGQEEDDSIMSKTRLAPDYYDRSNRFATGGLASLRPFAVGGPVAADDGGAITPLESSVGNNQMFPQANVQSPMYSQPAQVPMQRSVLKAGYSAMVDPVTGDQQFAHGGGIAALGGRPLRGPGDGMSDDIPATIEGVEPARLADGEYVLPADVVSHLGNGSTDAGTRRLDQMMARIRKARTGNSKQGRQINPDKFLPA